MKLAHWQVDLPLSIPSLYSTTTIIITAVIAPGNIYSDTLELTSKRVLKFEFSAEVDGSRCNKNK